MNPSSNTGIDADLAANIAPQMAACSLPPKARIADKSEHRPCFAIPSSIIPIL